ncbi:MAG: hypothetical protein MJZ76_06330 [Bacteroidales bacterium]|nr:hypothetical protein [Bacteroidales bacterium]
MKKITDILIFSILFIWQLPQNLIALCILPFSKGLKFVTYRNYCIVLSGRLPKDAGGVSLGSFAIITPECLQNESIVRHEVDGHTVDSKILGPLYLLVIGLPSVLHLCWFVRNGKGKSYDDFYTERWANRHAGLK